MLQEEIQFLKETASKLLKDETPVLLEWGDVHQRTYGEIVEVHNGGIVFHDEAALDGVNDFIAYGKIDKLQSRPLTAGA